MCNCPRMGWHTKNRGNHQAFFDMFHSYGVEDAFNDAFQGSIHKNDSYTMLPTLKKMHGTAWKLIGDYVAEVAPVWDISIPKTAQGVACP